MITNSDKNQKSEIKIQDRSKQSKLGSLKKPEVGSGAMGE